ncbi:hypothetical protein EDM59_24615 [Brevibacillus nitrificans]|uniref:Uncharacterized protein n=1 Tax=Brevibacillus nitrificans TaxID=651560 RepID=A0A3M8CXM0_9BACL|nr:hypothetical protein [Brevibacillus nitrificans]MED1796689.1 hypothetical protein [Brevibacillus nitrificans]RNB80514.1 hypothetical protein EDM59_24615 [Brevibacillus nitrificans]
MSRTELAQQRLDSYTHDMDQLLQEQKKDYPEIVRRAIRNEINQLQKSIRHWDNVLQSQTND